jgi:hypothetical protein
VCVCLCVCVSVCVGGLHYCIANVCLFKCMCGRVCVSVFERARERERACVLQLRRGPENSIFSVPGGWHSERLQSGSEMNTIPQKWLWVTVFNVCVLYCCSPQSPETDCHHIADPDPCPVDLHWMSIPPMHALNDTGLEDLPREKLCMPTLHVSSNQLHTFKPS